MRRIVGAVLVLSVALEGWRSTEASENFRPTLATAAAVIASVAKDRGAEGIAIGDFTGPPAFGSTAGSGIRRVLAEELARKNLTVKKTGGTLGIRGQYRPVVLGSSAHLELEMALVNAEGQTLSTIEKEIPMDFESVKVSQGSFKLGFFGGSDGGATALVEALGGNVNLSPKGKPAPWGKQVLDVITQPKAVLKNGWATAADDCLFYLRVLVSGKPVSLRIEDGQPWVDLQKQDVFELEFYNGQPYEVAASFHLDGVNTFSFSEYRMNSAGDPIATADPDIGQPRFQRFIIPPGGRQNIKGWHKNVREVTQFKMVDFVNSAYAKLGGISGLGTISCTVRSTWPMNGKPPADEIPQDGTLATFGSEAPFAAGEGERLRAESNEDKTRREYGRTRAVVTIRYSKPDPE